MAFFVKLFLMNSISKTISLWFAILMVLLTLGLGIAFVFTDLMKETMYGNKRLIFIFLMFGYAIYRGYRLYLTFQKNKINGEND